MKVLVVLLGLVTATLLPGEAAVSVTIRVYNATNKVEIIGQPFTLGTKVLLICDVTGLPNGSVVVSYRWYHNCTSTPDGCELQNGDSYNVTNDTLLMNVTSHDQGGWYKCTACYLNQGTQLQVVGQTPLISVEGGTRTSTISTPVVSRESPTSTPVVSKESPTSTPAVSKESPLSTLVVSRASPASTPVVSREGPTSTPVVSKENPTSTPAVSKESPPSTLVVSRASPTSTPVVNSKIATSTPVVNINPTTVSTTTTARSTGNFSPTPSGPKNFSRILLNTQHAGTFIGVGVGVGMFLLLVLLTSVVVLILVVVVRRKMGANKQKKKTKMGDNLNYNNTIVEEQQIAMQENSLVANCENAHGYHDVENDKDHEKDPFEDGFNQYAIVDRKEQIKAMKTQAAKESATSASATKGPAVYAVVDKSKKKRPKETGDLFMFTHKEEQYAMPIRKEGKLTVKGEAMVRSGVAEEEEQYDDTVG